MPGLDKCSYSNIIDRKEFRPGRVSSSCLRSFVGPASLDGAGNYKLDTTSNGTMGYKSLEHNENRKDMDHSIHAKTQTEREPSTE